MVSTYTLSHPLWGWLCLPDYPCAWSDDKARAHHFVDRSSALLVRRHWHENVPITVTKEKPLPYTPRAYAQRWDGKFWLFLHTPNNSVVRLASSYVTHEGAEQAIMRHGFVRIPSPAPMATLHRANTTAR
jgi:hypothetical protein